MENQVVESHITAINPQNRKRILIVEDDLFLATIVRRAIQDVHKDSQIDWAISLDEALHKVIQGIDNLKESPYEFVVADVILEGRGTGLDFWKVLKQTYPQVPLMVISSLTEDELEKAIAPHQLEKPPHLQKPFTMKALKKSLKENFLNDKPCS